MTDVALPPLPTVERDKLIPLEAIQAVVARIAARFQPEKIILFGSYAYGTPQPGSDVDLLVVMETELAPRLQRRQISEFLSPKPFSMDLIIRTPENLAWRLEEGDFFLREIVRRGTILYEKSHA
jgi:predicted nucleotidyltransferase